MRIASDKGKSASDGDARLGLFLSGNDPWKTFLSRACKCFPARRDRSACALRVTSVVSGKNVQFQVKDAGHARHRLPAALRNCALAKPCSYSSALANQPKCGFPRQQRH